MISEALQSELLRFKFYSLSSKILKIPTFNLDMMVKFIQAPFNPATAINFAFNDMKKNCNRETRIETCKQWMGL